MKDLSDDKKVEVLLAALNERYESLRAIRERVQSVGIWALGIFVAAGGAVIGNAVSLTIAQKALYIVGIVLAVIALRFKYLADLSAGFKNQQRVAARLEQALGLYTPGVLDDRSDSVYPSEWKQAGTIRGGGRFFRSTHLLLYVGVTFFIASILLSGNW